MLSPLRRPIQWMVLISILLSTAAFAHPLGNESVTHIAILWVLPDRVEIDLFLDFAEMPSQPYPRQIDADDNGQESLEEQKAWLMKRAAEWLPSLMVTLDGRPVPLTAPDQAHDPLTGKKMASIPGLIKIPGVAGMPTYKTLTRYVGRYPQPLAAGEHALTYEDATFGRYNGLKRIVLEQVPSVTFRPPHPVFLDEEGSAFLYDQYDPANLPQERKATVKFRVPEGSAARVQGSGEGRGEMGVGSTTTQATTRPTGSNEEQPAYLASITDPRNDPAQASQSNRQARRIVGLLQGRWSLTVLLTVTVLSFAWGAAHALMPGHAKTVVAAYLISRSGSYWHAVVLAVVVTLTHTALVVVLGLVIWLYQASHPALGARLQLWLGIIAGLLVALMGLTLIWRALAGRIAHHHHDHDHGHEHDSWFRRLFTHSHPQLEGGVEGQRDGRAEGSAGTSSKRERGVDSGGAECAEDGHAHHHHHDHHHHPHAHPHPHADVATPKSEIRNPKSEIPPEPLTFRMLLLLGVTGGIVPCPTATIILLLGIGANVVAGALYAVGVFSLGLAITLMLIGFLALSSRRIAARILSDARHEGELSTTGRRILLQAVPAISGALVVLLGLAIAANYTHHLLKGRALIGWLG